MNRMSIALRAKLFQFHTFGMRFFVLLSRIISRQTYGTCQNYFFLHRIHLAYMPINFITNHFFSQCEKLKVFLSYHIYRLHVSIYSQKQAIFHDMYNPLGDISIFLVLLQLIHFLNVFQSNHTD